MIRLSMRSGYCASPAAYAALFAQEFPSFYSDFVSKELLGDKVEPLARLNSLHDRLLASLCVCTYAAQDTKGHH